MSASGSIVIAGGTGAFGSLIAARLASRGAGGARLVIAGRDGARAEAAAQALRARSGGDAGSAAFDAAHVSSGTLRELDARVVINASGPYQGADYTLARAAIAAGAHYADLADGRAFVTGITALDREARAAGVAVVSGASTVPGLSSAVVQALRPRFAALDEIEIFVSPGNHFQPGVATVASILGYVGKPFGMRSGGAAHMVYGWQGLARRRIAGLGERWSGYCDVPDLDLFAEADPKLSSVVMRAGVEVAPFHLGLWAASFLVRAGIVPSLSPWAGPLMAAKRWASGLGTDRGGMRVALKGRDANGAAREVVWHLVAGSGHGPYIPGLAAAILARKLVSGSGIAAGARPCFEIITLDEFMAEMEGLDIATHVEG